LVVASLEETRGGALVGSCGLAVASLKETLWGTLVGPVGLAVASLKETRWVLSRFDCVYSGYITQGCPGGALAVAMSLRARCFFFPTHEAMSELCHSYQLLAGRSTVRQDSSKLSRPFYQPSEIIGVFLYSAPSVSLCPPPQKLPHKQVNLPRDRRLVVSGCDEEGGGRLTRLDAGHCMIRLVQHTRNPPT
jgi:hypothetical protein